MYKALLEGGLACLLVIALIWLLTQLAIFNSRKPSVIKFESSDKVILTPYNASITGRVQLSPMTKEYQKEDFSYMYGRELLNERKSRYVSHWADEGATLNWLVKFEQTGIYQIIVRYKADSHKRGVGVFGCRNQTLPFVIDTIETNHEMVNHVIGEIAINVTGKYPCSFKVSNIMEESFINFCNLSIQKKND